MLRLGWRRWVRLLTSTRLHFGEPSNWRFSFPHRLERDSILLQKTSRDFFSSNRENPPRVENCKLEVGREERGHLGRRSGRVDCCSRTRTLSRWVTKQTQAASSGALILSLISWNCCLCPQILKQEEDIRSRTSTASDAFRKEVLNTQAMRQEYFNLQLPRILRVSWCDQLAPWLCFPCRSWFWVFSNLPVPQSLKESAEEIDNGTQYHLARYAFLFESTVLGDGMAVTPVGSESCE